MIRYFVMNKRCFHIHIAAAAMVLMLGFSTQPCSAGVSDVSKAQSDSLMRKVAFPREDDPFDGISFPTIYKTGFDACTNNDGKPVIFLFASSLCSHCEWVGKIFDLVIMNYMEDGRIEAHHYDILKGDDLLTEEMETVIPEEILQLYHRGNPKDLVPYINFSCKYERVGNGYEETQDAEAEGQEMIDVIETLIQALSASGKKMKMNDPTAP